MILMVITLALEVDFLAILVITYFPLADPLATVYSIFSSEKLQTIDSIGIQVLARNNRLVVLSSISN